MSSKFQKETYSIGDLTLVVLIGDEREAVALVDDEDDIDTLSFNSNSWPRLRRSTKSLISDLDEIPGLYSSNVGNGIDGEPMMAGLSYHGDEIVPGLARSRHRTRQIFGKIFHHPTLSLNLRLICLIAF